MEGKDFSYFNKNGNVQLSLSDNKATYVINEEYYSDWCNLTRLGLLANPTNVTHHCVDEGFDFSVTYALHPIRIGDHTEKCIMFIQQCKENGVKLKPDTSLLYMHEGRVVAMPWQILDIKKSTEPTNEFTERPRQQYSYVPHPTTQHTVEKSKEIPKPRMFNKKSTTNILNDLTVKKLRQLALAMDVSPCGIKEKLVNKIVDACKINNVDIQQTIEDIKHKQYFVRCGHLEMGNIRVGGVSTTRDTINDYHQYYTNITSNLSKLKESVACDGEFWSREKCPVCYRKSRMTVYMNEFYEGPNKKTNNSLTSDLENFTTYTY